MNAESTQATIDVPGVGTVPVQIERGKDGTTTGINHRPPLVDGDPRLGWKNLRIVPVNDGKSYAVLRQKVLLLTKDQRKQLKNIRFFALSGEGVAQKAQELTSIIQENRAGIVESDCPDLKGNYTVLLDWAETTVVPFPELRLLDADGNKIVIGPDDQQDNFLVSTALDGDPHHPPVRPPAAFGSLNTQPGDFRTASAADVQHYGQDSGPDNGPAVAVLDTGLKFNLRNEGDDNPPYVYQDADGQNHRFTLAYQNQSFPDCDDSLKDNHLGYCALMSYYNGNEASGGGQFSEADVKNSPFDDFRIHDPNAPSALLDARHGTFVTAIIQQNGNDAPVLPVKIFDNVGFATLFDVLNGFNYVLQRCETSAIRVVNTSWIFDQDNPLLREKIGQLGQAGVLVIAAAGNEGQTKDRNLDNNPVYPACYSTDFDNVIAVTSVRKTYFPAALLSPKQDSIIEKALGGLIGLGLFKVLEGVDDVVGAIVPTAGYVAVENYSTICVNVGVVSTFGYFRSPFRGGPAVRGSSFACAFVAGFVIRQLRTRPELVAQLKAGNVAPVRRALLEAMNGNGPDENLKNEYVKGGYYLDGYAVD